MEASPVSSYINTAAPNNPYAGDMAAPFAGNNPYAAEAAAPFAGNNPYAAEAAAPFAGNNPYAAEAAASTNTYLRPVPLAAQPPVQLQTIEPAGSHRNGKGKPRGKKGKKGAGHTLLGEDGDEFVIGTSAI